MTESHDAKCDALSARIEALKTLMDEREDRTKERFALMEKNINVAMTASDKAVTKAETATEKRFESVNEFRETLRDQAATLMPRAEYDVQHKALEEKLNVFIRSTANKSEDANKMIGERMEAMNKFIQGLQITQNTLVERGLGKREGLSLLGQIVLGVISVATSIGVVLVALLRH